jgi:hypothetical protein
MDLIRREVEACDHLGGFMLLQSMAGGTGAGLGASLAECVRDEYPSSFLLNHSIWCAHLPSILTTTASALCSLLTGYLKGRRDGGEEYCLRKHVVSKAKHCEWEERELLTFAAGLLGGAGLTGAVR